MELRNKTSQCHLGWPSNYIWAYNLCPIGISCFRTEPCFFGIGISAGSDSGPFSLFWLIGLAFTSTTLPLWLHLFSFDVPPPREFIIHPTSIPITWLQSMEINQTLGTDIPLRSTRPLGSTWVSGLLYLTWSSLQWLWVSNIPFNIFSVQTWVLFQPVQAAPEPLLLWIQGGHVSWLMTPFSLPRLLALSYSSILVFFSSNLPWSVPFSDPLMWLLFYGIWSTSCCFSSSYCTPRQTSPGNFIGSNPTSSVSSDACILSIQVFQASSSVGSNDESVGSKARDKIQDQSSPSTDIAPQGSFSLTEGPKIYQDFLHRMSETLNYPVTCKSPDVKDIACEVFQAEIPQQLSYSALSFFVIFMPLG